MMSHENADNPKPQVPTPSEPPAPHTATVGKPAMTPSSETRIDAGKSGKKQRPEPTTVLGKLWFNWVKPIGSVVVVVVVLRSTLIDWNDVPTGSMEPEIHVGDRIAVNRLAYGLQCPLTGPTIGVPFTQLQWDNPLDGIPQFAWGNGPARGDIVTFWNPVTKVRMVKRIVAIPGDTISMSGGVLTINGNAATYTDIDPAAQNLLPQTKYLVDSPLGGKQYEYKDLAYREETLLGETRVIQHIPAHWTTDAQIIEVPGTSASQFFIVDKGWMKYGFERGEKFEKLIARSPTFQYNVVAEVRDGAIYIDNKPVSFNELAELMLKPYSQGDFKNTLDKIGLGVQGHELLVDGKPTHFEQFRVALDERRTKLDQIGLSQINAMQSTLVVFHLTMMTSFGPITLGPDEYFMVGDNRNNSHDSRYFGPVMRSEITGEAFGVAISFHDNKMFAIPPDPDWGRFFKDLD